MLKDVGRYAAAAAISTVLLIIAWIAVGRSYDDETALIALAGFLIAPVMCFFGFPLLHLLMKQVVISCGLQFGSMRQSIVLSGALLMTLVFFGLSLIDVFRLNISLSVADFVVGFLRGIPLWGSPLLAWFIFCLIVDT